MSFVKLNRNQLIYMCMEMHYQQRLIQRMSSAAIARPEDSSSAAIYSVDDIRGRKRTKQKEYETP